MPLIRRCALCKKFLFFTEEQICNDCKYSIWQEEYRKKEIERLAKIRETTETFEEAEMLEAVLPKNKESEITIDPQKENSSENDVDAILPIDPERHEFDQGKKDKCTLRVPVIDNATEVYSYCIPLFPYDRDILYQIYCNDANAFANVSIINGKAVVCLGDLQIGEVVERFEMICDWLQRGDLIVCKFTSFGIGNQKIWICFYRDEIKKYAYCNSAVVKLTAYSAAAKQESIETLKPLELLSLTEDDWTDNKVNVLDWCEEPIGSLPKKYANLFLEDSINRVLFDHMEYDDEKDKYIPFVKIFWS